MMESGRDVEADHISEIAIEAIQLGLLPALFGGSPLPADTTSFIAERRSMVFFTVVLLNLI